MLNDKGELVFNKAEIANLVETTFVYVPRNSFHIFHLAYNVY